MPILNQPQRVSNFSIFSITSSTPFPLFGSQMPQTNVVQIPTMSSHSEVTLEWEEIIGYRVAWSLMEKNVIHICHECFINPWTGAKIITLPSIACTTAQNKALHLHPPTLCCPRHMASTHFCQCYWSGAHMHSISSINLQGHQPSNWKDTSALPWQPSILEPSNQLYAHLCKNAALLWRQYQGESNIFITRCIHLDIKSN